MDPDQLAAIQAHPLGTSLDVVREAFREIVRGPENLDTVSDEVLRDLLALLRGHPVAALLPSRTGRGTLLGHLFYLEGSINLGQVTVNRIRPLLDAVLTHASDEAIWELVYQAVTVSTPPQNAVSSLKQTPMHLRSTGTVINSSEKREWMDKLLSDELGVMYVDVPNFYEAFWGGILQLETASRDIFQKCTQGPRPFFQQGWTGWPGDAKQESVLAWLSNIFECLLQWAQEYRPTITRKLLAQPDMPLGGSVPKRKLDVGLVDDSKDNRAGKYDWSHILVPGELKSNPKDDTASQAHLDIARYVKEVFTAQPTRRFVLAFTLCGSWMRLWEFDRLGGIASEKFDINKDGQRFVSTILGFLWMDDEALGFDPTIIKSEHRQYIEVRQGTKTERLVIDKRIRRAHGIVGRATICWKAYLEGDESKPFVIKDSWQFPEREGEGKLLQEATRHDVTNVARHYYHETVQVQSKDDDIQGNVRRGLDITGASNYRSGRARDLQIPDVEAISRHSSTVSKRSSSQTGALLPPSKLPRLGSASPTKHDNELVPNRIHQRIVLRDYGQPIYNASSPAALLAALEGCIAGHESLLKAGFLHRDISINNLMINEGIKESGLSSFLIDLDLTIRVDRKEASGAKGITGTRAFIAIGVLRGEDHTFMHDLESFFWVLFFICIHYSGPGQEGKAVEMFEYWNYLNAEQLADHKAGIISDERDFVDTVERNFTPYYQVLISWVNRLRRVVFPYGKRRREKDKTLYSQMRQILRAGQNELLA